MFLKNTSKTNTTNAGSMAQTERVRRENDVQVLPQWVENAIENGIKATSSCI